MNNSNKISFIICVNDETYYEECLFYIERLHVPEGFTLDVFPVRQAFSIYQGYNQAMQASDAKYKIYMHQDVFLVYQDILLEFLKLFKEHPEIGMAGLLGCQRLPKDRYFYKAWDCGNVLGCSEKRGFHNELGKEAAKVIAVDGMFMMTQYDVPWREDVLNGWDFYDFSQSLEFLYRGYEVWVPAQKEPWCIHDCGYLTLNTYDERQNQFLKVYGGEFPDYSGQREVYPVSYRQQFGLMMELKEQFKGLLFQNHEREVRAVLEQVSDERFFDTELVVLRNLLEIIKAESEEGVSREKGFLYDCGSFSQAYQKYLRVKFELRREKYVKEGVVTERDEAEQNGTTGNETERNGAELGFCKNGTEISDAAKSVIREHTMWMEELR